MPDETPSLGDASIEIPISWVGLDDLPIMHANQFASQADEDGFYVSVGVLAPPLLIGSDEEKRAQAEQIAFVPVNPLARYALSRRAMEQLIGMLQRSLQRFDATHSGGGA